ncbi:FAD/NAD(P)-binding domain-containing protein [Obba rivulosa]|uniref:FAD/NAD(P)-binding domain-containing protein n=1 Tax=Obba rivulosa TaxID=1052685 RepID=A0A8E2DKQ2_9APHY|nr:FAD/NAD(P)-binding domain-containing protein [Obba rivulosa]
MDVDAVVFGTGLSESVTAAALSKAGFSIAHIDANTYYGGDDTSLTLDELVQWADQRASAPRDNQSTYISAQRKKYTSISRSSELVPQSRQYSLSLAPTIIPSIGPLIDSLVASGVSRYGGFKLMERLGMFDRPGVVRSVPSSKEDVFKSKELSLVDKRRLMRFLVFAAGEFESATELKGKENVPFFNFLRDVFSLDERTARSVAYGLAFCVSAQDPTLSALQRLRRYSKSVGRYGPSAFLVGHYGGIGEVAQGFCRTSAVSGGTYVLGRRLLSVSSLKSEDNSPSGRKYVIELEDFPDQLACDLIISSPDYISTELFAHASAVMTSTPSLLGTPSEPYPVARCIAIIDRPIRFCAEASATRAAANADAPSGEQVLPEKIATGEVDTAFLVFSPSSVPSGSTTAAVHMLVTGEGSMSAPSGKWIVYISRPLLGDDEYSSSAEELMRPYLDATLSLTTSASDVAGASPAQPLFTLFYIQQLPPSPASTDATSTTLVTPPATSLISELADAATEQAEKIFWRAAELLNASRKSEDAKKVEVESFWPPLDVIEDEPNLEEW